MKKTCSVIVAENYRCPKNSLGLYKKLKTIIQDFGLKNILAGTDGVIELKVLDFLLEERGLNPELTVTAVVSSEKTLVKWDEEQRVKFFDLIVNCDRELLLAPPIESLSQFYKHLVMVEVADIVILLGADPALEFIIKKNRKKLMRFDPKSQRFIPDIKLIH